MKLVADTFNTHQPKIAAFAKASPENMARVYRFVIATVQQPLIMTPEIVREFDAIGAESKYAFGFKGDALAWLIDNEEHVYCAAMGIWDSVTNPRECEAALLSFFASCPGLGLVKAGFMVQLCFGVGGCLDTHNINRFGLNECRFKSSRFKNAKTDKTRRAIVAEYLETVAKCGGVALLWAEWCEYVAQRDKNYDDAAHVSRMHCEALGIAA